MQRSWAGNTLTPLSEPVIKTMDTASTRAGTNEVSSFVSVSCSVSCFKRAEMVGIAG